jgi:flagellar biosynthesis/type III secretory pathway protein FliH
VIAGTTVGSEKNPNLTETRNGCDATTPALFSEELKQFCCSLEQQVHRLNSRYLETLSQFQELAVQLAMEVATAVVGYEVQHHENRIRQLLDRLVNRPESPIPMVIHVNKIDLERLRISLRDTTSLDSMLQLKNDDSLSPGDVRIESAEQRLIASCRQQLANIQKQLMEYLTNARPEPATS